MPTLLGIVDSMGHRTSDINNEAACNRKVVEPKLGFGYDQWCALASNSQSPRQDAVVVLDDHTNFVSYIKTPYKILIGKMGGGEYNSEPEGTHTFNNATVLQIAEEFSQGVLDYACDTRDISFFWHEVIHAMLDMLRNRLNYLFFGIGTAKELFSAGVLLLGSRESGDVLASTLIDPASIPIKGKVYLYTFSK
jgi:hypothetical protein